MNKFTQISPYEMSGNPIEQIGREWMLVSAAKSGNGVKCGVDYNTMTASWGGVGVMWGKPVAFVFIRPERHTYTFIENSDYMTLSFFGAEQRETLAFCGKTSGRDTDKAEKCSLTPVFTDINGERSVYFDEAKRVLTLRKMYADPIDPALFVDPSCMSFYEKDGLHKMYICEIVSTLERE